MPVGRMSPLSATTFLLCALALLGEVPPLGNRRWSRQLAAMLTLAMLSIGGVVLLSYVLDAPLLYGTRTVPMASVTALSAVLLGSGIVDRRGQRYLSAFSPANRNEYHAVAFTSQDQRLSDHVCMFVGPALGHWDTATSGNRLQRFAWRLKRNCRRWRT